MNEIIDNYGLMNLNQLWVFYVAASEQSFTRAAEKLHLTQPGVSNHVKELERFYGVRLFNRLPKKVTLTQAGEMLFENTQLIFRSLDETKGRIDDLAGLKTGRLNIGSSITIGTYILPSMVKSFHGMYPGIEISITVSFSRDIEEKVLSDAIEIGLIAHETNDNRLEKMEFMTDEIVLAVYTGHPWTKRKEVTPDDLAGEVLIQSSKRSGTTTFLKEKLHEKGIQPYKVIVFGNTEASKKAVEAGLGISFISRQAVSREIEAGLIKTVSVSGLDLRRKMYFIFRRDRYISNAAKAFLASFGLSRGM